MTTYFRAFQTEEEEKKASELIATIDKGEKWIFEGAEGANDFGGFIDRLYYTSGATYGTYCSCIFGGKLRIQIGFNTDMPDELCEEVQALIEGARRKVNTFTSVWYVPDNEKLENLLFHCLPWQAGGHKTHELTAFREDFEKCDPILREGVTMLPFDEKYGVEVCTMLDKALAHTFDDPNSSVFMKNRDNLVKEWTEKANIGECCVMLENDEVAGAYILKGAEIDLLAVAVHKQKRGLGKLLLGHAVDHIFHSSEDLPYLYCIDRNVNALRFYLREGMKVTGYSGYVYFSEI